MTDPDHRAVPTVIGMLHDVDVSTTLPTDGDTLVWDATAKLWKPGPVSPIENVNTVAASGSTETLPDVTVATMHFITLTANCALTAPTVVAGGSFLLWLIQDGTGSRTVTWGASFKFGAGTAPTLSTGAGKRDLLAFACGDGSQWDNLGYRLDVR